MVAKRLVLASASAARQDLLRQIGFPADIILAADIDETPFPKEKPRALVCRLAQGKAEKVAITFPDDVVLAADTIVYCRGKILGKPADAQEAENFLQQISGRRHKLYTGLCIVHAGQSKVTYAETVVKVKRLKGDEIKKFLNSNQWQGKAGGYSLRGSFAAFIEYIQGTDSCIVGLPLNKVYNILSPLLPFIPPAA